FFNRMIEEKIKNTRGVRLRGLEKRKDRKKCLQEVRNTKAKVVNELASCDRKDPIDLDLKYMGTRSTTSIKRVHCVRECELAYGYYLGKVYVKEGLCLEMILKIKNEDDEDKDEIKGLIWVYDHIANKREKSGRA
ncbi:hypothetical protein Tco_1434888, partial [Tanacetum coccineum]